MTRESASRVLVERRFRALTRSIRGARAGEPGGVHQARVATRRIREIVPILAAGQLQRRIERKVRRLTRALGPVRELDVALLMLDEFEHEPDAPRAGIVRLKQFIRHRRREKYAKLRHAIERVDLRKLRRRLASASDHEHADASRTDASDRLVAARSRAARRASKLQATIEDAGGVYLPDRLHAVRIAAKKLRYALEIVKHLSGSRATTSIAVLQGAQDLLGRMHDFEILIGMIREMQGAPAAPDFRLSADLDRLVRRLETECRRAHGVWIANRRKLTDVCVRTIAASESARRSKPAAGAAA